MEQPRTKPEKIALAVFAAAAFGGAIALGQFVGGHVFGLLESVPEGDIGVTTLVDYLRAYGHLPAVQQSLKIGFGVSAAVPLAAIGLGLYAAFMKARPELHGSARLANRGEVLATGLLAKEQKGPAIIVGKMGGEYLQFAGQQHVTLAAPTRSGKGVSTVVPNLVHYADSVVVEDIKLENWRLTAGFRAKHGHECYLFSPDSTEFMTHRWNSLSYVRRDPRYRVTDILSQASIMYPTGGKEDFWNESAQTLFLGLVLYALDTPGITCSLPAIVQLAAPADGSTLAVWIKKEVIERAKGGSPLSVECSNALLSFAGNSENTAASILSTLLAPLNIFRDPITAAACSGDDFDLRDVRRKRMSIYLGIKPNNLAKYGRLFKLFFSLLINENTQQLPEENERELKYQCLMVMDEFAALGRVDIIEKAITYMAGYNMRLLLIYQNQSQLVELYGREGAKTISTNCAMQICFAPRDNDDAKEYSEMLGYYTYKAESRSRQTMGKSGASKSESDQRRALLLPQEVKEIGNRKAIISLENAKPMLVDKIRWYEDPIFKERVGWPVPKVPRQTVVPSTAAGAGLRTRDATAAEVERLSAGDFVNSMAILDALGAHMKVNFADLVRIQATA